MSGLEVRGLTAGYAHVPVIRDLQLSVAPGEVVALIGRNGAGKSTTLMAIAGLLPRCRGSVSVDAKPLKGSAHRRARRAGLVLVLEGRSVFPSLSTVHNLRVGRADVGAAFEMFPELVPRAHVRAGLLSGGEQQMLALARALCRRPRVLLLDELSFGLAPVVCERLFAAIRSYAAQSDTSILLVEQHLRYAEQVADRALVMQQGELRLSMPARELSAREHEIESLYLGASVGLGAAT